MLRFNAKAFYDASLAIQRTQTAVECRRSSDPPKTLNIKAPEANATLAYHIRNAERLRESLVVLGARLTLMAVDSLLMRLRDAEDMSLDDLTDEYNDIRLRLSDELSLVNMFVVEAGKERYLEPENPLFGAEVDERFPSVAYDVEECFKCSALGRSTASAIHAIRCLEVAIGAMAHCLGIADPTRVPDRSWQGLLHAFKDEIDRRWPGRSVRLAGDGEFFHDAYAALVAMQNPWRNSAMHLDQKYTDEEALHIIDTLRRFMKTLARRMDETGEPRA